MARLAVVLLFGLVVAGCSTSGPPSPPAPTPPPEIAPGLQPDTVGLVETLAADGSPMVHLQGRFEHVPVAYRNPDGTITIGCANAPQPAPRIRADRAPRRYAPRLREYQ